MNTIHRTNQTLVEISEREVLKAVRAWTQQVRGTDAFAMTQFECDLLAAVTLLEERERVTASLHRDDGAESGNDDGLCDYGDEIHDHSECKRRWDAVQASDPGPYPLPDVPRYAADPSLVDTQEVPAVAFPVPTEGQTGWEVPGIGKFPLSMEVVKCDKCGLDHRRDFACNPITRPPRKLSRREQEIEKRRRSDVTGRDRDDIDYSSIEDPSVR